jgi:hypothetical protein
MMTKQILTTGDVLEMLGLAKTQRQTVRTMVETKVLRPMKTRGKWWRFRRAEVLAVIGKAEG